MSAQLNESGITVLLTTHYLEEAQALCDRIAIINHGRLIACETTDALLRRLDSKELMVTLAESIDSIPDALAGFHVELVAPNRLTFHYPPSKIHGGEIVEAVRAAGLTIQDLITPRGRTAGYLPAIDQRAGRAYRWQRRWG